MNNELKWGFESTSFMDKKFGQLNFKGFGYFSYEITNRTIFESLYLNEKSKNNLLDYDQYVREILITAIKNYINSQTGRDYNLLIASTNEIITSVKNSVLNYGFAFKNISFSSLELTNESISKVREITNKQIEEMRNNSNLNNTNVNTSNINNTNVNISSNTNPKGKLGIIITIVIVVFTIIFAFFNKLSDEEITSDVINNKEEVKIINETDIINNINYSVYNLINQFDGTGEYDKDQVLKANSDHYYLFELTNDYNVKILVDDLNPIDLYIVGFKNNINSIILANKNLKENYDVNLELYKSYENIYVVMVNNTESDKNYKINITKKDLSISQSSKFGVLDMKFIDEKNGELYFDVVGTITYEILDNSKFESQYQTTDDYIKYLVGQAYLKYIADNNINNYNNLYFITGNDIINYLNENSESDELRFSKVSITSLKLTEESEAKVNQNEVID